MEKLDYIKSKLEQLQAQDRELDMLRAGINSWLKRESESNVRVGHIAEYQGQQYEVIAIEVPNVYYSEEFDKIKYKTLCLKLVNGKRDKSDFAKNLRKKPVWNDWHFTKAQEKLKAYYKKNVISLVTPFWVKIDKSK